MNPRVAFGAGADGLAVTVAVGLLVDWAMIPEELPHAASISTDARTTPLMSTVTVIGPFSIRFQVTTRPKGGGRFSVLIGAPPACQEIDST